MEGVRRREAVGGVTGVLGDRGPLERARTDLFQPAAFFASPAMWNVLRPFPVRRTNRPHAKEGAPLHPS
jgi:hypothetical protein